MPRIIAGFAFEDLGPLALERHVDGSVYEYVRELGPGIERNPYGAGPFAERFRQSEIVALLARYSGLRLVPSASVALCIEGTLSQAEPPQG